MDELKISGSIVAIGTEEVIIGILKKSNSR